MYDCTAMRASRCDAACVQEYVDLPSRPEGHGLLRVAGGAMITAGVDGKLPSIFIAERWLPHVLMAHQLYRSVAVQLQVGDGLWGPHILEPVVLPYLMMKLLPWSCTIIITIPVTGLLVLMLTRFLI